MRPHHSLKRPQHINAKRIHMEIFLFVCLKKKKYCLKFIKSISLLFSSSYNSAKTCTIALRLLIFCFYMFDPHLVLFHKHKVIECMKDMNLCLCSLGKVPHTPNHSCSKNKTAQSKLSSIHFSLAFSRVRRTAGLFFLSTLIVMLVLIP